MTLSQREKQTYRVDLLNRIPDGIINQLIFSAFLLIAIKVYSAGDVQKVFLSSARNVGLMAGLLSMPLLARLKLRKSSLVGGLVTLSGGLLVLSGFSRSSWGYTLVLSLCALFFQCRVPYLTSIYSHNYGSENRALLYSRGMLVGVVSSLVSSLILGRLMDRGLQLYRPLFIAVGLVTIAVSLELYRLPSERLTPERAVSPLKSFAVLFSDPYFGYFTLIWTIFGFAGLSVMTMQVVHLAEAERGLGYSSLQVMLITGVLGSLIKILFNRPMINFFSRTDIYRFRLYCNILIALGAFLFFYSRSLLPVVLSYSIFSIGLTGDVLMWGIFVTRVAPPGKTHIYMSVHTFGAGLRGILGPGLSFLFIQKFTLQQFGLVSSAIILFSGLMTLPVILGWWKLKPLAGG